ncbi:hypothetical protein Tco_0257951 [Tanacetum coccineum]
MKLCYETSHMKPVLLTRSLGWHSEDIHVTWAQFWKKSDKIANGHKEGTKNQSQKVETASGNPLTPFRSERDSIREYCDGVRISRHKRNPGRFIEATTSGIVATPSPLLSYIYKLEFRFLERA